jgi:hypothetical protein
MRTAPCGRFANFSFKAIGRLSHRLKGPGVRALLNPAGGPYRQLIETHRKRAKTGSGHAPSKAERDGLLDGIKDPAQRARIELLRTEVASLRRQIQLLQQLVNQSAVIRSRHPLATPESRRQEQDTTFP